MHRLKDGTLQKWNDTRTVTRMPDALVVLIAVAALVVVFGVCLGMTWLMARPTPRELERDRREHLARRHGGATSPYGQ